MGSPPGPPLFRLTNGFSWLTNARDTTLNKLQLYALKGRDARIHTVSKWQRLLPAWLWYLRKQDRKLNLNKIQIMYYLYWKYLHDL